ncbi:class II histone deacetylase complex subunits 2 and 3-domain-containing protein [Talaromyces proteolyticus]|uniref:Class II histone deacetylase complex subunits 2 and 3-domain-containing protein n=1 Tax=Talaromyces proteolyticus TaxID=1131652 RepID=A0AAD4KXJ5_9EURO|nr:class II histone deacetylase complex subunits 2 and 3-domain-containing protein [Talaromyces proteolyticus]KAH8702136.1 class II histone deacetylase complex subunits 2 and 3-domain-containing protein [Talaromyces proteolyticus]
MDSRLAQTHSPSPDALGRYDDIPGATPRERVQNAHARLRATASATSNPMISASATPSSAGDIDPAPVAPIPETTAPLSVRTHEDHVKRPAPVTEDHEAAADIVVPPALLFPEQPEVQTIQPSAIFDEAETVVPGSLKLGPSEFAISLPMDSRSKDEYERAFAEHSHSVKVLLAGFKSTDGDIVPDIEQGQILADIRTLLEKLDNIALHTDLNIAEHVKQSQFDPQKEASWAEYTSAKFLLLGHLIEIAGAQDLHIIVMTKAGKGVELVERYFLGKAFTYTRPREEMHGNIEVSMQSGPLSVGIHATNHDAIIETYRPPAAILALDSSFNTLSPSVGHLRSTYARNGNLLPVVHLIISNSSEHIQRCLPDLPETQRLMLLVHIVDSLRDLLGDLQDDALSVQEDAEELFTYLLSENFKASWNIPTIEPLHILVSDSLEPQNSLSAFDAPQPSAAGLSMNKRLFDSMDTDSQDTKRQRLHVSQEASQVTDSSPSGSQNLDLITKLTAFENKLVEMKSNHAAEIDRLQTTLSSLEDRSAERDKGWEVLQHRYESRTKEVHQTRQERDKLVTEKTKTEQKLARQQDEITKLKDERTQLKQDLEAARNDLKAEGGMKEELENAREEIRKLTISNASLERKTEYERKQAEYTREQYQNASNAAAQSGNEIRQLKEENAEIKNKLAAEAVKLREIRAQTDETRHTARIKELEQALESRETLLRRKEEELRNLRNNRPTTRATSTQPRSPKWGNGSRPTSPGINNGRFSNLRFSSEMSF